MGRKRVDCCIRKAECKTTKSEEREVKMEGEEREDVDGRLSVLVQYWSKSVPEVVEGRKGACWWRGWVVVVKVCRGGGENMR